MRKQHVKCGPAADRLDCSGGTTAKKADTVRAFTAKYRRTSYNPCYVMQVTMPRATAL